jgi:hypothetical protein
LVELRSVSQSLFYFLKCFFICLQVDSAESLLVECSGVPDGSLLSGSIIRPNQFRSLPNLRNAPNHVTHNRENFILLFRISPLGVTGCFALLHRLRVFRVTLLIISQRGVSESADIRAKNIVLFTSSKKYCKNIEIHRRPFVVDPVAENL